MKSAQINLAERKTLKDPDEIRLDLSYKWSCSAYINTIRLARKVKDLEKEVKELRKMLDIISKNLVKDMTNLVDDIGNPSS